MKQIFQVAVKILCLAFLLGNVLLSAHVHKSEAHGGPDTHKSCTVCQLAQLSHSATNDAPQIVVPEFRVQAVTSVIPKTPVFESATAVSLARAPPAIQLA